MPRLAVSHAPPGYDCPFCAIAAGAESEFTAWRDAHVVVQISRRHSPDSPQVPGNALVIPRAHYENLYALPDDLASRVAQVARRVAIAMRTGYPCDGVTVRQNNEPAGGQDVWHLHTHVIPRHTGDRVTQSRGGRADDDERARYAALLCRSLAALDDSPGSS
ncbi:MAG: HIT family protein [Chloroflexi bacterium]|nr:HIT family protein [Chloroflexota bacterium]